MATFLRVSSRIVAVVSGLVILYLLVQPLVLAANFYRSLPASVWVSLIVVSIATGILAARTLRLPKELAAFPNWMAFFVSYLVFGLLVASTIDAIKIYRIKAADPDRYLFRPAILSFFNAPKDLQFFLHAALRKDCKAYAWSHTRMDFYPLPETVTGNVVPPEWISACPSLKISLP